MLYWVHKQKVASSEGWVFQSKDRYTVEYVDENNNSFYIKYEGYFDSNDKYIEDIFFDTISPVDSTLKTNLLKKELIKLRIRQALKFMGINFKECTGDPDEISDYDPTKNIISRGELVLEEIESFSSKDEFERFKLFLDKQIEKGLLKEMEVNYNYSYRGRSGGRWYREDITNKYWRLLEPEEKFKGSWELVRKELIK